MASDLRTQIVAAPVGGLDTETADAYMPANRARGMANFLPGRQAKLPVRGGVRRSVQAHSTPGTTVGHSGGWAFDDKLLTMDGIPASNVFRVADMSALTISAGVVVTGMETTEFYPMHARAWNYVYGFTSGSSNPDARRSSGKWTSSADALLVRWDGGTSGSNLVKYTVNNPPLGGRDIKMFLGRLWILGGSEAGSAAPTFNANLYWSIDVSNQVLPDTVAAWETGGVVNEIVLEGGENDYGVALAILNGRMVILRRNSIFMLTGTSPENFQVRRIANIGCVDGHSILEWDDGIFFLSDAGLVFFDGAQVSPISGPITSELMAAVWQTLSTVGLNIVRISSEHFMICAQSSTRNAWIYHVPTGAWSRFTTDTTVMTGGAPLKLMRVGNYPVGYDGDHFFDLSTIANPEQWGYLEVGRDYDRPAGLDRDIPADLVTRTFKLGTPEAKANLLRLFADYKLKASKGLAAGNLSFLVDIEDHRGVPIVSDLVLPADGSAGESSRQPALRKRAVLSAINEVEEVRIRVSLSSSGSVAAPLVGELHDFALEYQLAQQRSAT